MRGGGDGTARGGFPSARGLEPHRDDAEPTSGGSCGWVQAPQSQVEGQEQGGVGAQLWRLGGRGPLTGGLPDAGAIIALADVATDRLYVVVESEEGTLHLLLSDAIAREALGSPDAAVRLALRRTANLVGFQHISSGRFLQARRKGLHKLVFFAPNFGVNEQFEVRQVQESNSSARYEQCGVLTSCVVQPRRFPNSTLNVRMYNLAPETPTSSPWQQAPMRRGMMTASRESPLDTTRGAGYLRTQAWVHEAPSIANSVDFISDTRDVSPLSHRVQAPSTFAISQSRTSSKRFGTTPSFAGPSQEDALELGMRLVKSFTRNAKGHRRLVRLAFALWKTKVDIVRKDQLRNMQHAYLTRRSIMRRGVSSWRDAIWESRNARALAERLQMRVNVWSSRRSYRWFREWKILTRESIAVSNRMMNCHKKLQGFHSEQFAFGRWTATTRKVLQLRVKVRRNLQRTLRRMLFSAFLDWCARLCETRKQEAKLARYGRFMLATHRRVAHSAFSWWVNMWREQMRLWRKLQGCVARFNQRSLTVAFSAWVDRVVASAELRAALTLVLMKWSSARVRAAFEAWQQQLSSGALQGRLLIARSVAAMIHRRMRWSLGRLRDHSEIARGGRWRLQKCLVRMTQRALYSGLSAWVVAVKELRQHRTIVRRVLAKISRRVLVSTFHVWKGRTREKQAWVGKLALCERFVAVMRQRSLFGALSRWNDMAIKHRQLRRKLTSCISRLSHRLAYASLIAWKLWTAAKNRHRRLVRRSLVGMRMRIITQALYVWTDKIRIIREVQVQLAKGNAEWEAKLVRAERVILAIRNRMIADAFRQWHTAWSTLRRQGKKVASCLGRISHRMMHQSLERWRVYFETKRSSRQRLKRFLTRLSQHVMHAGFYTWASNMQHVKTQRHKLSSCLTRRWQRTRYAAFSAWASVAEELTQQRAIVRRSLHRVKRQALASSFHYWLEFIVQARHGNQQYEVKLAKAEQYFLAMKHRGLISVWALWHNNWRRCKMQRRKIGKVTGRLTRRQLYTAFNSWYCAVTDLQSQDQRLQKHLTRMSQHLVSASIRAWVSSVKGMKIDKQRLERYRMRLSKRVMFSSFKTWAVAVHKVRQQRTIVLRMLAKISHRVVASMFANWIDMLRLQNEWARKLVLTQKFIAVINKRALLWSVSRWYDVAQEAMEMRMKVRRSVQRMLQRVVSSAFSDWLYSVEAKREHDQQVAREEQVWESKVARCERFVGAMQRRTLHAAFMRWEEMTLEAQEMRVKVQRCLQRMTQWQVASAFMNWAEMVDAHRVYNEQTAAREEKELQAKLSKMGRFVFTMQTRFLRTAYTQWMSNWQSAKMLRKRLLRCLTHWNKRALYSSYTTWAQAVQGLAQQRMVMQRVLANVSQRMVASAFYNWDRTARARRKWVKKIARSERFIGAMHRRALLVAFSRWNDVAKEAMEMRVKVRRSVQSMSQRVVSSVFVEWVHMVEAKREHAEQVAREEQLWKSKVARCERFVGAMQRRTLHAAIVHWDEIRLEQSLIRRKLQRCIARLTLRSMMPAFNAWVHRVGASATLKAALTLVLKRWNTTRMRAALDNWAFRCYEAIRHRNLLSRCLAAISNRRQRRGFTQWCCYANAANRDRIILQRAFTRVSRCIVTKVFGSWRGTVRAKKEWEIKLVRLKRLVAAIQLREARAVLARWREMWLEAKHHRVVVQRILEHVQRRVVYSALDNWHDFAHDKRVYRRRLAKISFLLDRRGRAALRASFSEWVHEARGMSPLRRMEAYVERRDLRDADIGARMMRRHVGVMSTRHAFSRWQGCRGELVRDERNATRRLGASERQRVFAAWRKRRLTTSSAATAAALRFRRHTLRLLRHAFATWEKGASDGHCRRVAAHKLLSRVTRAGVTWGKP